jgi:hypothetical protein
VSGKIIGQSRAYGTLEQIGAPLGFERAVDITIRLLAAVEHAYSFQSLAARKQHRRPLALFQLKRVSEAAKALRFAKKIYPLVAQELIRETHVRPHGWQEDRITLGGADQAYAYWKEFGKFWRKTPGALAFAGKIAREKQ